MAFTWTYFPVVTGNLITEESLNELYSKVSTLRNRFGLSTVAGNYTSGQIIDDSFLINLRAYYDEMSGKLPTTYCTTHYVTHNVTYNTTHKGTHHVTHLATHNATYKTSHYVTHLGTHDQTHKGSHHTTVKTAHYYVHHGYDDHVHCNDEN